MVTDKLWDNGDFPEGAGEDDGILMYLDSGCNSTCHGERWMKRYEEKTGYSPDWEGRKSKDMTGIGGPAHSLGTRKLYIALETLEGFKVPGEIVSTEIADSPAPLLLSPQAQQNLGMVIDLVARTVISKTWIVPSMWSDADSINSLAFDFNLVTTWMMATQYLSA